MLKKAKNIHKVWKNVDLFLDLILTHHQVASRNLIQITVNSEIIVCIYYCETCNAGDNPSFKIAIQLIL